MKNKILILTLTLAVLAVAGKTITTPANALENNYPSLIQKIAETFNLNQGEVENVVNQNREEVQQERQQLRTHNLDQAVENGVLTNEQKEALENKWQERKSEMEQHREEMNKWMEEQNIDHEALRQYMGYGGNRAGFRGMGPCNN